MNWLQKIAQNPLEIMREDPNEPVADQPVEHVEQWNSRYPIAGGVVGGLKVYEQIDNMSSIGASLYQYEILSDVREVPMSDFGSPEPRNNFYSRTDIESCRALASEIKESGEIMPLIVAVDGWKPEEGPYILEGGHRFVALHLLGIQTFPALVVADLSP